MTKATYEKEHLIGGLPTASEGEFITIMHHGRGHGQLAGKHVAGAVAESSHLSHKREV